MSKWYNYQKRQVSATAFRSSIAALGSIKKIKCPFGTKLVFQSLKQKRMKSFLTILTLLTLAVGCIPPAPVYPYEPKEKILADGQRISDSLENYIKQWLSGQAGAAIPAHLIPAGIADNKNFYLKNPDQVSTEEAWAMRPSHPVNRDSLLGGLPDPNVTYLLLGPSLAPFGSKLIIEGEFPYCRFFSIQVSAPLDGKTYTATRYFGAAEVSIADADIEPLPGHTNPFRVGANRAAANRRYRMEFNLTKGDAVALNNGAFTPPYRGVSNQRAASLLVYQGPWGEKDFFGTPKANGGKWDVGNVWLRIYAPDKDKGAMGGVAAPKVWYELPDGRKYFIGADFTELLKRANATMPARVTNTPPNANTNAAEGWYKSFGIVRSILNGACLANGWPRAENAAKVNAVDLGVTGRGENQAAPGNYEPHATTNNYASYLGRSLCVQKGMVAVLVGKLPQTPRTRNGGGVMQRGQLRYWSICAYDNSLEAKVPGSAVNGIMDEELTLSNNRNYIIAYSRAEDKPANASPANGVTWVDWGPTAELGLMMRYVMVSPEWDFEKSPAEWHLPWATSDWAGSRYDSTLIGVNHHKGFMECYLPRVVVMTRAAFEALGTQLSPDKIPAWIDDKNKTGINEAFRKPLTVSSSWDNSPQYTAVNLLDGNLQTRWASRSGQMPAVVTIDLQQETNISGIKLFWEWAHATRYAIAVSSDGRNWNTIHQTTSGDGGIDLITQLTARGRYVQLTATRGWLPWVSLWEMEVVSNEMPCATTLPEKTTGRSTGKILNIFPNPATQFVNIVSPSANAETQPHELRIFSADGKIMHQSNSAAQNDRLNCAAWPVGLYHAQVSVNNKQYNASFIKQ
jgi:F5/8 type C domain/Secretion system C-terminal sorting domain